MNKKKRRRNEGRPRGRRKEKDVGQHEMVQIVRVVNITDQLCAIHDPVHHHHDVVLPVNRRPFVLKAPGRAVGQEAHLDEVILFRDARLSMM